MCEKLCPSISAPAYNQVREAYAAWSKDAEVFRNSASGGIAAELYKLALSEGWSIVGCKLDADFVAHYYLTENEEDIKTFQNSKYVQSHPGDIYQEVKKVALLGNRVLCIGLPCHVAALDNYSRKYGFRDQLVLVDIVCHGTPPSEYLFSHIKSITRRKGLKADQCYFRDPHYGTDNYIFSVYAAGKLIYKNPTRKDLYTYGYHHMLTYRDCCYNCQYAKRERIGDITLCDYSGLGTKAPWTDKHQYISCVLINSERGLSLINKTYDRVVLHSRPVDEPLDADRMFNHPSQKKPQVNPFKEAYRKMQDYDNAAECVFRPLMKNGLRQYYNPINRIRPMLAKLVPTSVRKLIKRILGR